MYQSTVIVGNVGRDPEMKYTPAGQAVTTFSVAVSEGYGEKKYTLWFRVTAWGKTAEACNNYVKKGDKVLVDGRLSGDAATGSPKIYTKKDGTSGTSFEMTANNVKFLSSKSEHAGDAGDQSDGF